MPPSLFVLSLPRSFSSVTYQLASHAVGLTQPIWTSDGELLNSDRFAFCRHDYDPARPKYVTREGDPQLFDGLTAFLDQVCQAEGFAYKDVIQPFVLAEWLADRDFRILKIRRDLAEVAHSVLNQGWHYPAAVVGGADPDPATDPRAVIQGLARAQAALEALPGETVDYRHLVTNETALWMALTRLYPDRRIAKFRYIDAAFAKQREAIAESRRSDSFQRVARLVCDLRDA